MLGVRIVAAKLGEDVETGKQVDMSFDSDLNLQKIAKGIHGNANENTVHGLTYPPEVLVMEKVAANRTTDFIELNYGDSDSVTYWYCPSGVTSITVKAWGGGGAGGGIVTNNVVGSGGGGAGGQYVQKTISVTPGTTYTITVTAIAEGTTGNGASGSNVIFGPNLVVAKGGNGGKSYENGGAGGVGSTTGGVGSTVYKGGNANGYHLDGSGYDTGGEGGGGAGTTGNGGNALGNSWPDPGGLGTAERGGNGAQGLPASSDGFNGFNSGGGGGGGFNALNIYTTNRKGGNGAYPRLEFSYTRTLDNPEYMANTRGTTYLDSTNFYVPKNLTPSVWYAPTTDIWTHILLDPTEAPVGPVAPLEKDIPVIKVYSTGEGESDYKNELNTFYDSLKVFKTGTLTINAPVTEIDSRETLESIIEVTVAHDLGYVPMFAPFVNSPILLNYYIDWLNQYGNRGAWASARDYYLGQKVTSGGTGYKCIRSHTSSASTEPGVGGDWEDYWEVFTALSYDDLNLNDFEDVKFRFGGIELFDYALIEYYATTTDLVFRLTREAYNWEQYIPAFGWSTGPLAAVNISVDYTIFYNKADEEFNLLT